MKHAQFDPVEMVERIHTDRLHGASWLAREAARDLAIAASEDTGTPEERLAAAQSLARALALARPSMAAIAMTVAHVWAATSPFDGNAHTRLDALRIEVQAIEERWHCSLGDDHMGAADAGCGEWRYLYAQPVAHCRGCSDSNRSRAGANCAATHHRQ